MSIVESALDLKYRESIAEDVMEQIADLKEDIAKALEGIGCEDVAEMLAEDETIEASERLTEKIKASECEDVDEAYDCLLAIAILV